MRSIREMINLMEGVMAVPGVGLDEKSKSEKQARFMAAAAHDPAFAKRTGMDSSVAKEFNKADTGTEQLSKAMQHKESAGMYENVETSQWISRFNDLINSYVDPQEALDVIARELDEYGVEADEIDHIMQAVTHDFEQQYQDDRTEDEKHSAEMPPDDYYDHEVEEAFDLNNGYDDINDASGDDYFPDGFDSPVVRDIGGNAKQGDNPEQKRVAVAEVHKELVYSYRNFLQESSD